MRVKRLIIAAASASLLALAGGSAVAAASVSPNATPACGTNCQDFSSKTLGPGTILNAYIAHNTGIAGKGGQVVNMKFADNSQVNADFEVQDIGQVWNYCNSALNPQGFLSSSSVACVHYRFAEAYELNFQPFGNASGYCAGTRGTPVDGLTLHLIKCGTTEGTLWIQQSTAFAHTVPGYNAYISGATSSFSHPYVAAVQPGSHRPANQVQLQTENLLTGNAVPDNEQFTYSDGPLS